MTKLWLMECEQSLVCNSQVTFNKKCACLPLVFSLLPQTKNRDVAAVIQSHLCKQEMGEHDKKDLGLWTAMRNYTAHYIANSNATDSESRKQGK